jgi:transcription elongation factor Elf1
MSCRVCQHGHQRTWYLEHQDQEKERVRRRRVKAREEAREYVRVYKRNHPCENCGESDPIVLDFHHVRGKGANVGKLIIDGANLERIKAEIALCKILCSNCHRKATHNERKRW